MTTLAAGCAIPLWSTAAPGALGAAPEDTPRITIHRPTATATGVGVVVAPGGGYRVLAADHEGLQVARWLNGLGIATFVLRYRVGPRYHSDISLLDGRRAVRLVRANAKRLGVYAARVGMLGFSAGGHLTVAVGTRWDAGDAAAADPVERVSARPDFLAAVYPVTNGAVRGRKANEYTPADTRVDATTPPTFLAHTHEDAIVPASQSTLFYDALLRAGVPAELHIFGHGEHGLGLAVDDPDFGGWPALLANWLRRRGLLTDAKRVAVSGTVTRGGQPMGLAAVTFTPVDGTAPPARARTSRPDNGRFAIPATHGLVPGPHRVRVFHLSAAFPPTSAAEYTLEDAASFDLGVVSIGSRALRLDVPVEAAPGPMPQRCGGIGSAGPEWPA